LLLYLYHRPFSIAVIILLYVLRVNVLFAYYRAHYLKQVLI